MKRISREQVLARVAVENPWWRTRAIGEPIAEYKPRAYFDLFFPLLLMTSVRRAVVLMGPRRVGKTVMLHHAIGKLLENGVSENRVFYVSVDHPIYNDIGLEELLSIFSESRDVDLSEEQAFVFFDEIQYLRDWERHLKAVVDRYPKLRCVASGSAAAALRLKSAESGAGRFTDFLLPPLAFHEYLSLIGEQGLVTLPGSDPDDFYVTDDLSRLNEHFVGYLNFGGYPEVVLTPEIQQDPGRFIKQDIIDKVLLRDLPSLYGIRDIQELNSLFTTLAFNTADEISLEGLSQGSGVAKQTIKRYIEYLEAAFLIKRVDRVDINARRFKRANYFKIYLTNPSIRAALFSPVSAEDEAIGSLAETAVFSQWFHSTSELHYARWRGGEVDIVNLNEKQKAAWAVEVKWSDRYVDKPGELQSLISFCAANEIEEGLVTTRSRAASREVAGVHLSFIPASLYCYTVGYNLVRNKQRQLEEASAGIQTELRLPDA